MKQNKLTAIQSGRSFLRAILVTLFVLTSVVVVVPVMAQEGNSEMLPNIVLVHGAWSDGSIWSAVTERLQGDGYNVIAPQFSLTSVEADVARLEQYLARLTGPIILVGHSYGGEIITALGPTNPNVVGLVYIAAFGLDEGETIGELLQNGPPMPALANMEIDAQGFAWLPLDDWVDHITSDVDPAQAKALFAAQQPVSMSLFTYVMGVPTWKSVPSWYMVATNDEALPPDAERFFAQRMGATVVEIESSHVPLVSQPDAVTNLIETAAESLSVRN
ncbi:MAG: alpha/beta hydrolase [Acidiferrobacterales bacterium]|nr:alpha/beta hydrolase [Acidiferrobacterales bacterium]